MKLRILAVASALLLAACATDGPSHPYPNPGPPSGEPDRECPRADGLPCR